MGDRKIVDSTTVFDHGKSDRAFNLKKGEAVLFDFGCENCGHKPLIVRGVYTEEKTFCLQWNCLNCRHIEYQGIVDFIDSLQPDHLLKRQKREFKRGDSDAGTRTR